MSAAAAGAAKPPSKAGGADKGSGLESDHLDDLDLDGPLDSGSHKASAAGQSNQYERLLAQLKAVRLLQRDQPVPTVLLNVAHGKAVDRPLLAQDEFLSQAIAAMVDSSHAPAERRLLWNSPRQTAEDDIWSM